jgi:hypothetical protein
MDARGLIYEIWDRESQKAIWISKSLGEILDEVEDPLGLPEFFPCPKPLLSTMTTDSLVPIPDYVLYEDQARSLDTLADRIHGLVEALKVRGVYDASVPDLARLFSEGENNALIPVNNWMAFAEKNGLKGAIDLVDITMLGQALEQAYAAFEQIKQQVYEIIGLADIMRGVSQAEETLGAQQLKARFGGNRLTQYQNEVAKYATEILRLKGHVIATKFSPQTILQMGDAQQLSQEDQMLIPQALELLKNDPLRAFRVDIEADSMVQLDEELDKQSRIEFLQAMGGFMKEAFSAVQMNQQLAPLMASMVEFGCRGFKVGKSMEGEIDSTMDKMKALAQQPPPPPPEMMKIQAESQQKAAELQQAFQFKEKEIQLEVWKAQQEQAAQARDAQVQNQLEAQREGQKQQHEQQMELLRMEQDKRLAQMDSRIELLKALLQSSTSIQVAEIGKETTEDPAQAEAPKMSLENVMEAMQAGMQQMSLQFDQKMAAVSAPKKKTVVRGPDGLISHVIEEPA